MSLGLLLCGPVNCPVLRYKRGHGTDLHALSNLSLMSMGPTIEYEAAVQWDSTF